MVSQGYRDWLNAGKPYTLIRPARALQNIVRVYGITVWDYPNTEHQKADRPEDHTPYSVTGWPGGNRRWNARGLDIMPRSGSAAHVRENANIARQLIRDRDAGVPGAMWIKYLNWTDEAGVCRQERWSDRRSTVSSSDRGHIHISGRSDADGDARADTYDPIARMRGLAGVTVAGATWNDAQKADAVFNNRPTAPLDTDGTIDGSGNIQEFPNATHAALAKLAERCSQLEQAVADGGGSTPGSGGVSEERVQEMIDAALTAARITPGP